MSCQQRRTRFAAAKTRPSSAGALIVGLLAVLGGLTPALAQQTPSDPTADPRLARALDLLDKGRTAKAQKLLSQIETERPDLVSEIRLFEAERANAKQDWAQARGLAQAALELSSRPDTTILATAERAVAVAGSGDSATATVEAIAAMRRYLADRPDDAVTDRLRLRLCRVRELLPAEHPSSLSRAELPTDGEFKYLPKADPANGITTTKPQLIAERGIDATSEAATRLVTQQRARIDGVIDTDGCFTGARITNTTDETFSPIALSAVRGWVYRPPRCNEEPVGMFFSATVRMAPDKSLR